MKFLIVASLLAASAFAAAVPVDVDAAVEAPAGSPLEKRFNCADQRPRCPGGSGIEQTHCLCPDQLAPCHLRACPGSHREVCGKNGDNCVFTS